MNLDLNEEQKLLQRTVREFAETEVKPLAREIDETGHFPRETFRKAAELGLTAVALPESEGGAGFLTTSPIPSSSKRISYALPRASSCRCKNSLYCDPIHRFGTEAVKNNSAPLLRTRRKIGCYAPTEPQAGRTRRHVTRRCKADRYIINGTKAWITNGGVADAAIVYVNTDPAKGEKGITALVVERSTPGFAVGKEEKKLGIHATACTELSFTDCEVPAGNRIGNEGDGYKIALSTLDGGRIGIAAQATGIAQGAFEQALAYAQQRQAFGHPIADFQAIQFMLADMATEIDAARLLVRKAAWKQDSGGRFSMEASIAKLFASELSHS